MLTDATSAAAARLRRSESLGILSAAPVSVLKSSTGDDVLACKCIQQPKPTDQRGSRPEPGAGTVLQAQAWTDQRDGTPMIASGFTPCVHSLVVAWDARLRIVEALALTASAVEPASSAAPEMQSRVECCE